MKSEINNEAQLHIPAYQNPTSSINKMKLTAYLVVLISTTAVLAAPADQESAFRAKLKKLDLTPAQCHAACRGGAEAVEAICRRLPGITPHALMVKALCWGVSTGMQTSAGLAGCTAFCDAWF